MAEDSSEPEEEPTFEGGLAPYSLPPPQRRRYSYVMWFSLDIMTSVLNSDTT